MNNDIGNNYTLDKKELNEGILNDFNPFSDNEDYN